jgi:hypothetical protein
MGSSMNSLSPASYKSKQQGARAMLNSIGSWFCIMGLIIGPYSIGVLFEGKLQRANRELGSRLLRRY